MKYTGKGSDLFWRFLLWGILTIVTCGIYSPWAYNNLFAYVIEHIENAKEVEL